MKAVIYGAGNIGRGFIGQLFFQSGYELCFIDVADTLIDTLNQEGRYPIRFLEEDSSNDIWIERIKAINGSNVEDAAEAIASADIMATSVGVRVLPHIAPIIATGLKKRFSRKQNSYKQSYLNIIICENLINADKVLEGLIKDHLSDEEIKIFDDCIGLVEASIGRMVPLQTTEMQDGNPLRICVESYGSLPVAKTSFKGEIPLITGLLPFDHFDFYVKRKLFIHNMGHGICAYFGLIKGDHFIYESAGHGGILYITQNAMLESALALSAKYQMPLADLHYHIRDLLRRFSNKALRDTCARVAADPARKLGSNDRFIGALNFCSETGINTPFISAGTSSALYNYLSKKGIPQNSKTALDALKELSGINDVKADNVLLFYSMLAASTQSSNFEKTIEHIINAINTQGIAGIH